jgi:flagellar M-ring protein FliF
MLETFRDMADQLGARRALAAVVGIAALLLIWGVSRWAMAPVWVPLFPGMTVESAGAVTERLDEAGVAYRLERAGSDVRVRDSDLARARVLLAREGLPAAGRPGFELFDQPSWGMTDFTQRINYRRALEGELQRTIGKMRDVEEAQVHLALSESSVFRRGERPSEASVVLRLRPGARRGSELVEGIAFLVASSVDGLASENVTVLDDAGNVLSASAEGGSALGLTNRQLAMQREVERHLESKAEELLGRMVGAGHARVQVAATLNFDRLDRTVQTLDPERQVVSQEERSEVVPQPGTPGAGSVASAATYETARSVEVFSHGPGQVRRLTVAVLVNDRVAGEGESSQAAARTPAELARVEALVRNAVGIDETRGDAITVVSIPFNVPSVPSVPAAERDVWSVLQLVQRPALGALAVLLAFVVALRALGMVRAPASPAGVRGAPALAYARAQSRELGAGDGANPSELRIPAAAVPQGLPGREQALAGVLERPETAARLIRAWMKEG